MISIFNYFTLCQYNINLYIIYGDANMTIGWDGRPNNPEQSGFHWLERKPGAGSCYIAPCLWQSNNQTWRLWNDLAENPEVSPEQVCQEFLYKMECMRRMEPEALKNLIDSTLEQSRSQAQAQAEAESLVAEVSATTEVILADRTPEQQRNIDTALARFNPKPI
jgi:hypothetical protein